jgi:hypothetical protein
MLDTKPHFKKLALTIILAFTAAIAWGVLTSSSAHAQSLTVLYTFTGGADGGTSYAGLVLDNAGHFYGTTSNYALAYGTVFKIAP